MSRLVIVSNRVPLPSERGARAGGLAVALADALRPGSLWFGWSGKRSTRGASVVNEQRSEQITYATIDLTDADYKAYYVNFSNGALWPLLHSRLGLMEFHAEDLEGYSRVNAQFATALAPLLRPDDVIWVHDYHLMKLGAELRALGVKNRIGFFLHTPFVPPAVFATLPRASELLRDLCTYDVVGFHTRTYQQFFLAALSESLGIRAEVDGRFSRGGHTGWAIVDPIGIDAEGFARTAAIAAAGPDVRALRASLGDTRLAVGADRLDYSKGLIKRFEAIDRFFATYPQYRHQLTVLQVAARSREEHGAYQRLRRDLDRVVGDINGRYSEFDWAPLRYITRTIRRDSLAGFYRLARMAIITPLRDGMNLVAKEYIAAQDPQDPGVLILSRFAGVAEEFTDALIVNPYDADEIAAAMHKALTMDVGERRERWRALYHCVTTNTAERFCNVFLSHLNRAEARGHRELEMS